MDQLITIANRAKLRIRLNMTLHHSTTWLIYVAAIILLLSVADRSGQSSFIVWNTIWIITGVFASIIAIAFWNRFSISVIEAAAEVDQRLNLRDRISSAVSCGKGDGPYCAALLFDAVEVVEKEQVQSKIPQHFSITFPSEFRTVAAIALATAFIIWSPQWGFFGGGGNGDGVPLVGVVPTREKIEASVDSVLEQIREDETLSKTLEDELAELETAIELQAKDPETLRREALRKMTDLQKRLEDLLKGEQALAFEEVAKRLQTLELPQSADTLPMIAALKNGNFDKAKKELEQLQDKMDSTELSKEEREALAKALEELAKQLEELAQTSAALGSAMSAAGLNGALAGNSEAALKAIKNAKNLSEEQKKRLLEMLKAQQKANGTCNKLGQACKRFSLGKGGKAMASELEQLKAVQMFKTKAQLAKSACQKAGAGMCNKPGSGGTGKAGKGNGGMNRTEETDTTSVVERSPVQTVEGTIIARQMFEGGLLTTSESSAAVRETVITERNNVEQAIIDEEVPRKYHDLLRHYFGQLEELTAPSSDNSDNSDTPTDEDRTEPSNDDANEDSD